MKARSLLLTGPLAEMAEAISHHADSVMRTEALKMKVIATDDLERLAIILAGPEDLGSILRVEYGIIENFRFIASPMIELSLAALEVLPVYRGHHHPPETGPLRRAVRANEKARRKTMPRGRR